jgi:MYXO-CTERM domain-containing protein
MAGYDPKQKRAHSPTVDDGPAPVDDLLVAPATPVPVARPVAAAEPWRPSVPVSEGPDAKVIAVAAGAVVVLLLAWRWRRR